MACRASSWGQSQTNCLRAPAAGNRENAVAMTMLPAGTVTFLFSDIEGSTRLLRQLGDRYGELEADHRRIIREACEGAGGREIDRQGDAFFFSFPRARDGAAGAVAAQQALAAHAWLDGVEPKVRMGLHTGEPALGDEGYLGIDVVRAARIASAAHGGQILVSETTRALLPAELPDGATLINLGEHTLKDMDRPERLFQLVAPGLGSDFPAPRAEPPGDSYAQFTERVNTYLERQIAAAFRDVDLEHGEKQKERVGSWLRRWSGRRPGRP
jgi:class 3 adenylate cyclase